MQPGVALGARVRVRVFPELGHSVDDEVILEARSFLQEGLAIEDIDFLRCGTASFCCASCKTSASVSPAPGRSFRSNRSRASKRSSSAPTLLQRERRRAARGLAFA
jgi:hypothetical protein